MKILPILASLLLAGCASAPALPLTAAHPASAEAAEASRPEPTAALSADATTRKTRALLAAAREEQTVWNEQGPVSGTPPGTIEDAPKP